MSVGACRGDWALARAGQDEVNQEIARSFFRRVVKRAAALMSDQHFTADGTLIEVWASPKSFQRKDGGADGDGSNFGGQERKNA